MFTLAAFGLADLPPFATFLGKGWVEDGAATRGMTWIIAILVLSSVLVGGAVLRVAGGVFYGLGDPPGEDPEMAREASEETTETGQGRQATPLTMLVPAAVLVLAAIGIVFAPHLGPAVEAGALRFQDQAAYDAAVLSGGRIAHPAGIFPAADTGITVADVLTGAGSAAGGVVLAFLALYWRRLPVLRRGFEPGAGLARPIQRFQSGVVNDYVTWIVVGIACLGGALAFTIR